MNRRATVIAALMALVFGTSTAQGAIALSSSEDALSHYLLANALVKEGKHQEAIEEYRTAYRLFPESRVGEQSLIALNAYGVDLESPSQTESTIRRQSQEFKAETDRSTEAEINHTVRYADAKLANIEAAKNTAVVNVLNNPSLQSTFVPYGYYRNRFGYYYAPGAVVTSIDPIATQARVDAVRATAEQAKVDVKTQAASHIEQARAFSQERSRIIDETANNLESQMSGRGVKLKVQGTNLYVRSY